MPPLVPAPPTLSSFATRALLCLYQHRLLSTDQLRRLLCPEARRASRYPRRQLAALREHGLVDAVRRGSSGQMLWFLTTAGAALAEGSGTVRSRNHRMDPARAAGPLQAHTIALNDVGLAFVETARLLGHDCGPLDWIPEPAHRLTANPRPGADQYLIPDALLHYVVEDPVARVRTQLQCFLELDRATMTVARLAAKLGHYARYLDFAPIGRGAAGGGKAWRQRYPRFPRILIVLAGQDDQHLRRRTHDLIAHVHQVPGLQRRTDLAAAVTTVSLLQRHGPFEPIFTPIFGSDSTPTDLFLQL